MHLISFSNEFLPLTIPYSPLKKKPDKLATKIIYQHHYLYHRDYAKLPDSFTPIFPRKGKIDVLLVSSEMKLNEILIKP